MILIPVGDCSARCSGDANYLSSAVSAPRGMHPLSAYSAPDGGARNPDYMFFCLLTGCAALYTSDLSKKGVFPRFVSQVECSKHVADYDGNDTKFRPF